MELDAFTSRLGVSQGRVQPRTTAPADGRWAFVLGDDEAGRRFAATLGDRAELVQTANLTGVALLRARLTLRVPADLPAGLAWAASLVVDGNQLATATAAAGRTRTVTDLAANVSKLTGVHQVGVRLELVSG